MADNKAGAIVEINHTAAKFESSIVLKVDNKHVDVKSILGLSVTLHKNETYKLEIHGPDEAAAKTAMLEVFFKNGFHIEIV
ncbi:HPr family phosphocarrier protein [Paenibacillus glycanilyticus]|uniref:HPr family phosphocarrier protein n=1 Tax=Paenibacillus glycanilyticus TaxID=126569 RepID=UPI001910B4C0|nr:HPr family phosphocarrier protein [Paenibacillus glycanilyticus]